MTRHRQPVHHHYKSQPC